MRSRVFFALHRFISAVALLQLAAWTVSGLFFAAIPIARVRGEAVKGAHQRALPAEAQVIHPAELIRRVGGLGLAEVSALELRSSPAGLFYVARSGERAVRLDAHTGRVSAVQQAEAEATARRDQPRAPAIRSSQLLTEQAGIEYRGRPLPAWRVVLSDGTSTAVYVDATTGEVTARRNNLWRTYDFLWSLHIMDYRERESFNHPLLIAAALLGLLTVFSGASLWVLRLRRTIQRRRSADVRLASMKG